MNEKYKIQIAPLSANSPDFQDTTALLKVEYIYGGSKEEESHRYVC